MLLKIFKEGEWEEVKVNKSLVHKMVKAISFIENLNFEHFLGIHLDSVHFGSALTADYITFKFLNDTEQPISLTVTLRLHEMKDPEEEDFVDVNYFFRYRREGYKEGADLAVFTDDSEVLKTLIRHRRYIDILPT